MLSITHIIHEYNIYNNIIKVIVLNRGKILYTLIQNECVAAMKIDMHNYFVCIAAGIS